MTATQSTEFSVTLKLFAAYQEAIGSEEMSMTVAAGMTVADICDRLIEQYPELGQWRSQTRFGINLEFVDANTPVAPDDEVVLIPPVSGG